MVFLCHNNLQTSQLRQIENLNISPIKPQEVNQNESIHNTNNTQNILKKYNFKNVEVLIKENDIETYLKNQHANNDETNIPSCSINRKRTSERTSCNPAIKKQRSDKTRYEVEKIMSSYENNITYYFMKWANYRYDESTYTRHVTGCLKQYNFRCEIMKKIAKNLPIKQRKYYLNNTNSLPLKTICKMNEWEDRWNLKLKAAGQAPIWIENWVSNDLKKDAEDLRFDGYTLKNCFSTGTKEILKTLVQTTSCNCEEGTLPVILFLTLDRGWSIRTAQTIKKNSFVMEYVGEVLTLEEAKKNPQTYQFEMDCCGPDSITFVIDAFYKGNEARYVNHSCDPNLRVLGVLADDYKNTYHRLAFFASRDIEEGIILSN